MFLHSIVSIYPFGLLSRRTLYLLVGFDFLLDLESLARVNNIDDGARARSFKIFQKDTSVTPICVWRIDALRRKVIQLLEVCIPVERRVNEYFMEGTGVPCMTISFS